MLRFSHRRTPLCAAAQCQAHSGSSSASWGRPDTSRCTPLSEPPPPRDSQFEDGLTRSSPEAYTVTVPPGQNPEFRYERLRSDGTRWAWGNLGRFTDNTIRMHLDGVGDISVRRNHDGSSVFTITPVSGAARILTVSEGRELARSPQRPHPHTAPEPGTSPTVTPTARPPTIPLGTPIVRPVSQLPAQPQPAPTNIANQQGAPSLAPAQPTPPAPETPAREIPQPTPIPHTSPAPPPPSPPAAPTPQPQVVAPAPVTLPPLPPEPTPSPTPQPIPPTQPQTNAPPTAPTVSHPPLATHSLGNLWLHHRHTVRTIQENGDRILRVRISNQAVDFRYNRETRVWQWADVPTSASPREWKNLDFRYRDESSEYRRAFNQLSRELEALGQNAGPSVLRTRVERFADGVEWLQGRYGAIAHTTRTGGANVYHVNFRGGSRVFRFDSEASRWEVSNGREWLACGGAPPPGSGGRDTPLATLSRELGLLSRPAAAAERREFDVMLARFLHGHRRLQALSTDQRRTVRENGAVIYRITVGDRSADFAFRDGQWQWSDVPTSVGGISGFFGSVTAREWRTAGTYLYENTNNLSLRALNDLSTRVAAPSPQAPGPGAP